MGMRICPKCNKNQIKNYYASGCMECRDFKGKNNPKYKGKTVCKKCGGYCNRNNKTWLCGKCYKDTYIKGLPKCRVCGDYLSRYKPSKNNPNSTGICRRCYRGSLTRRWNRELTQEDRYNGQNRTRMPGYYDWRIAVFERDNYTCQKCGDSVGGNLVAHHINSFSNNKDLQLCVDNGITLCNHCHDSYHHVFGIKNANEHDFNKFMEIICP